VGLTVLAVITGVLTLVLLSPLLMREIGAVRGMDWTRLSEIGQTYGAASAILSALALGGIAISLFVQARQTRAQQLQTVRAFQLELLQMTPDNPQVYLPCWGATIDAPNLDIQRQNIFVNLIMVYQQMGYEIGVISEGSIRGEVLAQVFRGEAGRRHWAGARYYWGQGWSGGRRGRRFFRIVDDEYRKVIATGSSTSSPAPPANEHYTATTPDRRDWRTPIGTLLCLITGILLSKAIRARQRP
jgi:hypothetical protein